MEAWLIWWIVRRFLDYIEKDLATKIALAAALKELNNRQAQRETK